MTTPWLEIAPYSLPHADKQAQLLTGLLELTRHHRERCEPYARILAALPRPVEPACRVEDIPFLPVSLFKSHRLLSIPERDVWKTLTSSGTTGQAPSRVYLDKQTAQLQARALARIIGALLGRSRLPMVVIDSASVIADRSQRSARAAGVLGMMTLGHKHCFALDDRLCLDRDALGAFLRAHAGQRILLFGFTYLVWAHFIGAVERAGLRFDDAILVHSGGWKKLADEAVDNAAFKRRVAESTGIRSVYNFYGMAEQVGSVFLEGPGELLYPPAFADVIVRDPRTLQPLAAGKTGVLQVVSLLPRSYPGHSLLTEDLGTIVHVDGAAERGHHGKGFIVHGRVPKAELRGCSDVAAASAGAA